MNIKLPTVDTLVQREYLIPASVLVSSLILAGAWVYTTRLKAGAAQETVAVSSQEQSILPSQEVELPVVWGDLGAKLASVGAIDSERFQAMYEERGAFTNEYRTLLLGTSAGKLKITEENAGYLLNLFWALGLASKNPILDSGEMQNKAYGGAGNFASTGGWTLAANLATGSGQGSAMEHYSRHMFFALTPEQQKLVDKISSGIYRPCCNNSTHFPDCNHGMAMLGLLELMASQGVSEADMWKTALAVNSYWFPDTYLTIASYMRNKGVDWKDVNPQEILGVSYSSASGYQRIAAQVVQPSTQGGGGGCGVSTGTTAVQKPQQSSGCGI